MNTIHAAVARPRRHNPRRAVAAAGLAVTSAPRPRPINGGQPTIDELTRRFAQCRSLGHEWRHAGREASPYSVPVFLSICDECRTERRVSIPTTGANVQRRYRYPDGYQRKGEDRLSSVQWRRVLIVSLGV
jgi:hypothetical protein